MSENKKVDQGEEFVVKVTGVNVDAKVIELKEHLNEFTQVRWVNLLRAQKGKNKGVAYVTFTDEKTFKDCLAKTNSEFQGEKLVFEKAEPRTRNHSNTKKPQRKNTGESNSNKRSTRQPRRETKDNQRTRQPRVDVPREESNTVFVGNMNFSTTQEALEKLFATYGKVLSVRVIQNYYGRSKGFGYVEFESVKEANAALKVHGQTLDERELKVDISTQRPYKKQEGSEERPSRPVRKQSGGGRRNNQRRRKQSGSQKPQKRERRERKQEPRIEVPREQSTTLFVGNMSWDTTEETVRGLFTKYGKINSVRIIRNHNGQSKGFGYVEFETVQNVTDALVLNKKELDGRELKLDVSTQKPYEKKTQE